MSVSESQSTAESPQTIVADRHGVITRWGAACAQMFGYSGEEALGQRVDLIIPPVLQARHWRGFERAVDTGTLKRTGKTLKVPAIHKSGAVLAIEGALTLERKDDGKVNAVVLTLLGEGPSWGSTIWRAVLAVLGGAQAVIGRLRPGSGPR
jgi:PAS domain S-box-containing protein